MKRMILLPQLFLATGVVGLRFHNSNDPVVEKDGIRDHIHIDAVNQLWEGMDVLWEGRDHTDIDAVNQLWETEVDAARSNVRTFTDNSTVLPKLQLLGMFDSGTNLLGALLKKNLGAAVLNKMCPNSNNAQHCQFWKHTPPQDVNWHDLRLIAVVRSPLAHLSGWYKAPYDLSTCVNVTTDWLHDQRSTCSLRGSHTYNNVTKYVDRQFHGPSGVWNAYVRGYHDLAAKGADIKIIEYENVVMNTEKVVRDIGAFLGVPVGDFQQLSDPAKNHGNAVGRELAVRNIRDRTYMENFPWTYVSNVKAVCHNLEQHMMNHSFQLNSSEERLYKSDCE